jgi:hypothetical protein
MTTDVAIPPCWICHQPSLGVACSSLGAISGAYCRECLEAGREPWGVWVGTLMGVGRDDLHPDLRPYLEATLSFYGKTEEDLWADVEKACSDYEAACGRQDD